MSTSTTKILKQAMNIISTIRSSYSTATAVSISRHCEDFTGTPPPVNLLTENELFFADTVRKFSKDVVKPLVREMDKYSKMSPIVTQGVFENGLMGVHVPEEYGGSGSSFFNAMIVIEELAKTDPSVSAMVGIHNTLPVSMIIDYGTEEQKLKYLPRLCSDSLASFCISESGAGSDAFALKTIAKRDGDHFLISGTKMWITNSGEAQVFVVFANADPSQKYKGITCFIVERSADGLTVDKEEDKLGIRASSTCQVHFDNVRVHKSAILGEYGKGYKYAIECLNAGRIAIGAQMIGLAQGCFDQTIPYLQQREQFGQRLIDFQGLQHQIAQARTEIEAARLLVYNAARMKEYGIPYVREAAMAKLFASQVATSTSAQCVKWLGGVGFTKEFPAEKFYRDAMIGEIYEGTSNIQLNTIAKLIDNEYKWKN
ncbi:Short/branched chain specific acyl-CoA dehydrogenase, mitochondrial [Caenorhabditis elegans]|uniref:Short/branched chain specific acyl-CoA dehydrogenase, mitochondrial n=1 Tax=Caenorhabditis elegans TaxID=6239 RepID=H2KZG6_CAEEL|nr:Short/branched chain specific acyl-CoA dehydrogenase, mitochondrial [Caenorhabditis elegans]CCD68091.1 Short/branched chain specific acyl-CoA dehydrogenase, mitochondrial [Caenorhabditis elegans]|eukprot:NP_491871.1 Acyl CoA DeHydrogenase [Caenorhabditis elegans]